jgi:hypothetical protein
MRSVLALALLVVPCPAAGLAAAPKTESRAVEELLPRDAVFYFRYDGYEPHRKAYDRTALSRAMKEDLGEFLEHLVEVLADAATSAIKDRNPEDVQKLAAGRKEFLAYLWRHGLAVSAEVSMLPAGANPSPLLGLRLRVRLTVVFPEGGTAESRAFLLPLFDRLAGGMDNGVKKRQLRLRTVHEWGDNDLRAAWWQEGRHVLLVLGNDTIDGALDVIDRRRSNLGAHPLLAKLTAFKDYETDIRGFVDLQKVVDLLRTPEPNENKLAMWGEMAARMVVLQELGLTGLKNLTFHLGFDRQYQRSTVVVNVAEPAQRRGLLRLVFAPLDYAPAKLPPLPPDAASVRVSPVDWPTLYDVIRRIRKLVSIPAALAGGGLSKEALAGLDLGVDVPKEILEHLDSTLVLYNSLSEGPFVLGQGVAIKVKDEQKLGEGMQKLTQGLAKLTSLPGAEVQQRTYRGVDLFILSLGTEIPVAPTYAIHKGWLVLGVFPQSVKGFILRAEGKHEAWQPPALVAEALALARKKSRPGSKLAAVTVTDPRPATAVGLALMPIVARGLVAAGVSFDVSKVPNAQSVTRWQFPGVSLFYDDGNALRWESHFSIELPADWILLAAVQYAFGLASLP